MYRKNKTNHMKATKVNNEFRKATGYKVNTQKSGMFH